MGGIVPSPSGSGYEGLKMFNSCWWTPSTRSDSGPPASDHDAAAPRLAAAHVIQIRCEVQTLGVLAAGELRAAAREEVVHAYRRRLRRRHRRGIRNEHLEPRTPERAPPEWP